jgi:hypothetical protein
VVLIGVLKIMIPLCLERSEQKYGREETINRNNLCGIMSVKMTVEVTNDIIEM